MFTVKCKPSKYKSRFDQKSKKSKALSHIISKPKKGRSSQGVCAQSRLKFVSRPESQSNNLRRKRKQSLYLFPLVTTISCISRTRLRFRKERNCGQSSWNRPCSLRLKSKMRHGWRSSWRTRSDSGKFEGKNSTSMGRIGRNWKQCRAFWRRTRKASWIRNIFWPMPVQTIESRYPQWRREFTSKLLRSANYETKECTRLSSARWTRKTTWTILSTRRTWWSAEISTIG